MKDTVLTPIHKELGAKMAEFAGYNMPIQYSNLKEEHMRVRNAVGVFDVSHMGEFVVRGKEARNLVQSISSNDVNTLEIGDAQYSAILNDEGGIVDDMIVYRLPEDTCSEGEEAYMLVVNASNIEKDWNWISNKNSFDTRLINISEESSLLAIQGPKAISTLQKLTEVDLSAISYYSFAKGEIAGLKNVIISATGYTGSGGFELYVHNDDVETLWNAVLDAGEEFDILPCGLGCRDTLRLEMGYCLYGNDIDDNTSPLQAGLGWITKLKIDDSFTAKEILTREKEEGLSRRLVALDMEGRRVPRKGYEILDLEENVIGHVTSGTQSPMLDKPIGMGYVAKGHTKKGTKVLVKFGKKTHEATVTRPPFVTIEK